MAKRIGIVSAIGPSRRNGVVYGLVGSTPAQSASISELALYDKVEAEGGMLIKTGTASAKEYRETLEKSIKALGLGANAKKLELAGRPYRAQAKLLIPRLIGAAAELAKALVSSAPMVVRFHSDGDGISGATALYRAISRMQEKLGAVEPAITWNMNKRIAYGEDELNEDRMFFGAWKSAERPVLLITDFGTSPDSVRALEALREAAVIIMLDHHPPYEGFPRSAASHYINSWDLGADSDFTAGLLSCLLAEILCDVDVEDLKAASLLSDYSTYADKGSAAVSKTALILDFLAASGSQVKPAGIDAVLGDRERRDETAMRAKSMQDEALAMGLKTMRSYRSRSGINVYVLDFGHIAKLGLDFPPPGRLGSILQRELESRNGANTVTIIYSKSRISVRISGGVVDSVRILDVIARIKKSADFEFSGGGHTKAAGIGAESSHIKDIVDTLLLELGVEKR